jgi:hypothetical protein
VNCAPMLSIDSKCVRRGFEEYRIAANYLPGIPAAPGFGHNGVTNEWIVFNCLKLCSAVSVGNKKTYACSSECPALI